MSNLKLKVDELLSQLEKRASAEQIFAQNLSKNQSSSEPVSADTSQKSPFLESDPILKELDDKGRILARAFFDELQRLTGGQANNILASPGSSEAIKNIINKIINKIN